MNDPSVKTLVAKSEAQAQETSALLKTMISSLDRLSSAILQLLANQQVPQHTTNPTA